MLEEEEAWKREAGFDLIESKAEMDAQRFRTGFKSELFYIKLYNPRWPHTPEEYALEMGVDVERLRMELVLSQPVPPPQCYLSPRRSPVVGMGLDEPGGSRAEMQSTEREGIFPLQTSVDGCTSPEQEWTTTMLLKTNVGVDDVETTTTNAQAAACEEFARPPKNQQQRRVAPCRAN